MAAPRDPYPEPSFSGAFAEEALREMACEVLERNGMKPRLRGSVSSTTHHRRTYAEAIKVLESLEELGVYDYTLVKEWKGTGEGGRRDKATGVWEPTYEITVPWKSSGGLRQISQGGD